MNGHTIFTSADADRPEQICDRNGAVVLAQCKACGKAEVELSESCSAGGGQPQRLREPLTSEQMTEIYRRTFGLIDSRLVGKQIEFVRAIERAHGIGV